MDLVRDLLDRQLTDRSGRNLGRVDGVVLELRANRPPRVRLIVWRAKGKEALTLLPCLRQPAALGG